MTIFESTLSTETRNFPTLKQQKIRASPWKPASISHVWRKLGSQRLLSHVLSHLRPIVSTPNYIDVQERPSGLFMGKFVFPATFGRDTNKWYLPPRPQCPIWIENFLVYIWLESPRGKNHSEVLRALLCSSYTRDFSGRISLSNLFLTAFWFSPKVPCYVY